MKHCSSCGREITETATVCADCEKWTAEAAGTPSASADTTSPAPDTPANHRPVTLMLAAVAVGAMMVLALIVFRAAPSSEVAAAPAGAAATTPLPSAATPTPASAAAPMPVHSDIVKWTTDNRGLWVGNRRNAAAFEVAAENMVPIWMRQVRPMLVVRCLSNTIEAFVFTWSAMQMEGDAQDHAVTFSFDDEPQRTERWPHSAEHDALFAPDGAAFAARLTRARTLRFGYTPHIAPPATADFHVSGLAELMAPVARVCGSK